MSLSRDTVLELMALADGELEGDAKARAENLVAENEEARRVVDAIQASGVRAWLSDAVEQRAPSADGIADAVMARLGDEGGIGRPSANARSGGLPRVSGARPHSRLALAGVLLGSALALAAGVAMFVRFGERGDTSVALPPRDPHLTGERAPVASVGVPTGAPSAQAAETAMVPSESQASVHGVQVDEIDSPSHVSIFEIAAVANASRPSSVVVWIDDDPGEK
jgi:hypothetical protein